jgi:hypothetical protein
MQRKISFIVAVFLTVFILTAKAQQNFSFAGNRYTKIDLDYKSDKPKTFAFVSAGTYFLSGYQPAIQKISFAEKMQAVGISGDFYAQHVGFICKKEYTLEKATHIPFRFRLGSLEYCNYLEGKR